MASLKRMCLGVLCVSIAMPSDSAAQQAKGVPNAFTAIPYPRSIFIWWRPYQTVLTEETAVRIRSELDRLPTAGVSTADSDVLLGHHIKTAFLYPVLAGEGDKGAILLRRMLEEYSDGRKLDDRWLLIVFAMGCNDSNQVVPALRRELRRIQDMFARTDPRRSVDAKLPVIDAILINLSRHGTMTYAELRSLSQADPERAGAVVLLALNYVHRWMTQDQFLQIVREALGQIGDESILSSLNSGGQQEGYLRAIRDFLLAPRRVWPIAQQVVLNATTHKKHAHDFILVTYLLVMTHHANASQGIYDIDRAIVDQYLSSDLSEYPQASFAAKILLQCAPSNRVPGWDEYIHNLASHIRPSDVEMANYLAREARKRTAEKEELYHPEDVARRIREPGIYLYGFTRAGGMMHGDGQGTGGGR